MLVPKRVWPCKNIFFRTTFRSRKHFLVTKNLGLKKIWFEKKFVVRHKILVQHFFLSEKICHLKKYLGLQKNIGSKKILGPKKILVNTAYLSH